jgi:DNA repair exonuclease SbcCD ATPase subunit
MLKTPSALPTDIAALQAMVVARDQMIEALKLTIAKLQHTKHGASSERGRKLLDQLELQLAELQETIAEEEAVAELAAPSAEPSSEETAQIKPARRPLPKHLPRERVVHEAPAACPCCGGKLRKLGEDITETLEYVPARWKVIQPRERLSFAVNAHFCARSSHAGVARQSRKHQPRSIRSLVDARGRSFWRRSCSPNIGRICR